MARVEGWIKAELESFAGASPDVMISASCVLRQLSFVAMMSRGIVQFQQRIA